jgi:hypothetical protein
VGDQNFLINGRVFAALDPALQEALARVYGTPARPRCLCVDGGVEMYVSKFNDFVIKRMPETGDAHAPTCPSFALSPTESGLGQVLGEAVFDRGADGVELRLDFPLTRRGGRAAPIREPASPGVAVVRPQLSLHGLLHYLWDRAGFNRWSPRMQGRRSYAVVRKFLLQACAEVATKGLRLSERVFIPECFQLERAAEIARRHREALSLLLSCDAEGVFNLMIAVGELKELAATRIGYRLVLKHLPDRALRLDPRAGERVKQTFGAELVAWNSGQVRLVAACLIRARQEHCYEIDALTLMMTSSNWIPLDHVFERDVVDKLVAEERSFLKPLRYETRHAGGFPNFLLLDAGPRPLAIDVVSAFLSADERAAKVAAIRIRHPNGWVWDATQGALIPALPPKSVDSTARFAAHPAIARSADVASP